MLTKLTRALERSRRFQTDLLTQLQEPDFDALCSCCLETVQDNPDTAIIMQQLLNRNLQARSVHSIQLYHYQHVGLTTHLLQGVCSDHAEALRHREVGTAAFRRHDLSKAAVAYSGMPSIKYMWLPAQLMVSTQFASCTDCLHVLDETTISGSAAASHVYCNRALVLLQQRPPDKQAALQDSTCAIACDRANCKVSSDHHARLQWQQRCHTPVLLM